MTVLPNNAISLVKQAYTVHVKAYRAALVERPLQATDAEILVSALATEMFIELRFYLQCLEGGNCEEMLRQLDDKAPF